VYVTLSNTGFYTNNDKLKIVTFTHFSFKVIVEMYI